MPNNKSNFVTLESTDFAEDDKGNSVCCSHVRIDQLEADNTTVKSSSYHIKLMKIKKNSEGAQIGDPKQVFFPVALRDKVAKLLPTLKLDQK